MTESRISQELVEDVSYFWETSESPTMAGFAKKHGLNPRTLRRWRYKGWLDLAQFKESLFRTFAEELSKAQDVRKQVDAEKKRIRDQNKGSVPLTQLVTGTGRTKWGEVVSGGVKAATARLWAVLPLSMLRKEHLKDAHWNEPKKPDPIVVPDEWSVRMPDGSTRDIRELRQEQDELNVGNFLGHDAYEDLVDD